MWRPDFPHHDKQAALIRGFCRRFWQGSPDHRGVPLAPGRVVTLVPSPNASTHGVAFAVDGINTAQVLADLDIREQGGYVRKNLIALLADGRQVNALTYYADENNPHYLGPAAPNTMLEQIQTAQGPSGTNRDYVFKLAETLKSLGYEDDHVFELESHLRHDQFRRTQWKNE